MADIYSEKDKKGGERSAANRPSTKKSFHNVTSRIDCGTKKKSITASAGQNQSDGLTAKRKDELYGRLTHHTLAKFLNRKYTQTQFITKIKQENGVRMDDKGTDFNYTDAGYVAQLSHEVRLNKRPITGKPLE